MTRHLDFEAADNADWLQPFTLVDADGLAVNLEGATMRLELSNEREGVQLQADTNDGLVVTNTGQGEFEIALPEEAMNELGPGTYNWDLLVGICGVVSRVASGTLKVHEGVTIWTG